MRLQTKRINEDYPNPQNPLSQKNRYGIAEFSGSLGDLGTFLPLALAVALFCKLDITLIFIFAGMMNIASGLYFRQPIPVQPMKAIAAVGIAESLTANDIAAAGMIMGLLLLTLCMTGLIDTITHYIPKAIVRGIQLGIGCKLAYKGIIWLSTLPVMSLDSWTTAIIAAFAILLIKPKYFPSLIVVFTAGLILLLVQFGNPVILNQWQPPKFTLIVPTASQWMTGFSSAALPQLPLTLLNSVIAVCALSGDYFPKHAIEPRKMALSVSLMNLVAVPFGGMPMCHGSGGLAAQYRFGARTGGSVVMLGILKIMIALILGTSLITIIEQYPVSILAVTLIFAGFTLASAAKDMIKTKNFATIILMAIIICIFNTLIGLVAGLAIYAAIKILLQDESTTA